jgi:hypothetical protein
MSAITEDEFNKMGVIQLRRYVVDNKIFKGISKLKKTQLKSKILESEFWKKSKPSRDAKTKILADAEKSKKDADKAKIASTNSTKTEKDEKIARLKANIAKTNNQLKELSTPRVVRKRKNNIETNREIKKLESMIKKLGNKKVKETDDDKGNLQKRLDLGHTIVNVYANGSNHPDFPVPMTVVRHALNAQNLTGEKRQNVEDELRKDLKNITPIKGIPREAIPDPVPHPSHKNLKKETVEKLEKAVKNRRDAIAPSNDRDDSDFEESESATEKQQRERLEELAKVTSVSGKRGFNSKFQAKLEGLLGGKK